MFVAPSIAVAIARWLLPSRRPTPLMSPSCCRAFHPHCRCAVHRRYRLAVHQQCRRCVAIVPSVAIALPSRHPLLLLLPSHRPSTLSPLCHHCYCAVHRRCCCAVHHHCCRGRPSTSLPLCHRSAFCGSRGMTLLHNGRHCRAVHHRHRHHLSVTPSIAVLSRRPSLLSPPRCRRAIHPRRCSAVHCWQRCRVTVAPSITVVACQFCCPSLSTHSSSCRTSFL